MDNLARKIGGAAADEVALETARVVALEGGALHVRLAGGEIVEAARGASCLVAPEEGDLVLAARSRREGAFVVAVLRRESDAPTTLALDGDVDLRLASGRLRIAAQDGVDLVTPRAVAVSAGTLDVNAVEARVAVQALALVSDAVRAEVDRVKLLASRVDSVIERVSQRVKRAYRRVEESDHVRAERIDYRAEKTMSLHAEHALVTADELVKMDAEQIHLG
ncbi:MAG TPA: DUF3540 domain-containing protein [Byssovorax sp.]|jgi:hypothetical protein